MKLLLINPNTTAAITDLVLAEAGKAAAPGTEVRAVTGRFGARYIASRASYVIAGHAALDAYAEHGTDADAVVLACFGDPGLHALREMAHQPVVGMAEAACRAAVAEPGRFAIVTGGERWGPMLREFVAGLGLAGRLAAVETVAPSGADIASDPGPALDVLAEACRTCVEKHGASRVILGGAGLAGITPRLAGRVPAPLIDGLAVAVRAAERLAAEPPARPQSGDPTPTPSIESTGLSAALTSRLAGERGAALGPDDRC